MTKDMLNRKLFLKILKNYCYASGSLFCMDFVIDRNHPLIILVWRHKLNNHTKQWIYCLIVCWITLHILIGIQTLRVQRMVQSDTRACCPYFLDLSLSRTPVSFLLKRWLSIRLQILGTTLFGRLFLLLGFRSGLLFQGYWDIQLWHVIVIVASIAEAVYNILEMVLDWVW